MEATTLEGIGVSINAVMNLSDDDLAPERLRGTYISTNTFSLLRSKPVLGRDFLPEDDRAGAPPVVVVGYRVWQRRYGGDPSVIGRTVRINSVASTIVGVMPANFDLSVHRRGVAAALAGAGTRAWPPESTSIPRGDCTVG